MIIFLLRKAILAFLEDISKERRDKSRLYGLGK